ncbi:NAD(P)/FAD-dependent oxidoreductase [Roseovarius sp. D0-M9]|uniref:NAD(P)/FAD-dependent oxidoreductase n=1 Tax=Roseovarius sp. D0-M9 TaxID=3127117 RepID=UPI0030101CC1
MTLWTQDAEPGHPYWWDGIAWAETHDALPEKCDLLIIGAGYTGLSAALAAHDCGASIVVVDAGDPGKGASTRNGGMFGAHPRLGWSTLARQFGAEVADALFDEASSALDWAKDLIAREDIICDLQQTGRIQLAWTAKHFKNQNALAQTLADKSRVRAHVVAREDLAQEIATERYYGGIVFDEHCGIHPAKFHQGLMRAVLARGIPVIAECPVTGVERRGSTFAAATSRGRITAQKVLLATNGYTTDTFAWHARRVFALPSYIIATEPLAANLIGHLAPGRRMMVETRARHSYFRISPDGTRILFGGRASMVNVDPHVAARRLRATMCEVWPELKGTRISHSWRGNTGYSFTHMPHVGEDRGLHHAMGYSGSGTVMAPYLGAKAAYQAMGDARGQTGYSQTDLARHWMHPGTRPHFLHAANLWYRTAVDWTENLKSR